MCRLRWALRRRSCLSRCAPIAITRSAKFRGDTSKNADLTGNPESPSMLTKLERIKARFSLRLYGKNESLRRLFSAVSPFPPHTRLRHWRRSYNSLPLGESLAAMGRVGPLSYAAAASGQAAAPSPAMNSRRFV
jgi:hypothetical protein